MKKSLKIVITVLMSVIVLCFSCVTAFADTTVDDTSSITTTDYIKNNILTTDKFHLDNLPIDDYLVFINRTYSWYYHTYNIQLYFIPKSTKTIESLGHIDSNFSGPFNDKVIYYAHQGTSDNNSYLQLYFTGAYYLCSLSSNGNLSDLNSYDNGNNCVSFSKLDSGTYEYLYCNNSDIVSFVTQQSGFQIGHKDMPTSKMVTVYAKSLFKTVTEICSGYKGAVYDNSLEDILKNNGKSADTSIIAKYKYQIYYYRNNDAQMVFLNNAYKPSYKKDKYKGSNNEEAYKYKFHYIKTSDCIVYYPLFHMYLTYDEWYKFQPDDGNFKWFWEKDNKDFTLMSDWTYSDNNVIGTRVVINWEDSNQFGESTDYSSISGFVEDKDKLLSNGWKDGRPSDTNYPYCIEIDYNGKAGLFIYSNAKPDKISVYKENEHNKKFAVYMIGMYGYVYNAINDCYVNYDFTIKDGSKNFVQQFLFKYFSNELHCLDSDLCLTLYDNYRGSEDNYLGTRVFFNWDINGALDVWGNLVKDELNGNCKEDIGSFVDENGNHHGGNLNDYSDEDKNKYNQSGSNSSNTSDNTFDFSFDGIMDYCDNFFRFIQSAFSVFPSAIWLLISVSIAMLIALRLLGR